MTPKTKTAYKLFHEGVKALSIVEANGIKVDVDYIHKATEEITAKIKRLQASYDKFKIVKLWKKKYGEKTNLGSRKQLGDMLFNEMGLKCTAYTKTKRPITDNEAMTALNNTFVNVLLEVEKAKKARSTYLNGILRETSPDGFVHPFFNLNTVVTYRSSSDHPNFQNLPIRDPEYNELIRRAFIPRSPNNHIVEADYGGIEVRIAACYNKDPRLITYIKDPTKDMHRDMGMQCYMVDKKQMTKVIRYSGKNRFVFPEFYGNIYTACATDLWNGIDQLDLKLADGTPMKDHLRKQGIKTLGRCNIKEVPRRGTFEAHIRRVEQDFWENRFKVYAEWKEDWYEQYLENGFFNTLTGFRIEGIFKRNEVINYPLQGSAFHCLLWSLVQLVKNELRRYKMKTKIVGQIHDSIVSDVPHNELKSYLELSREVMVEKLMKQWKWIIVPLEVEFEVAPKGGSWFEKEEYKITD